MTESSGPEPRTPPRTASRRIWIWLLRVLSPAGLLSALSGCGIGVFDPHGPVSAANATILLNSVFIMLAIIVPTGIATLLFAWWFREGNQRARFLPHFTYSGRVEVVVWAIPTLVIIFLGGVIWIGSHELDPAKPLASDKPPLQVQVVSLDWKWLFIYPKQGIASINVLYLPTGQPVHFSITSASVMNVFFVPQLGSMIYAMNGMITQLNLEASDPGVYYGRSAQFSGDGFPTMQFAVHAVSDADFSNWVNSVRGAGGTLDADTYKALSRQSMGLPPQTYGSVEAGLFDDVATQVLPPGPGPQTGRPNARVIESANQPQVQVNAR
jgi:cytochrome o ubiquinol oxidase subunit 2